MVVGIGDNMKRKEKNESQEDAFERDQSKIFQEIKNQGNRFC